MMQHPFNSRCLEPNKLLDNVYTLPVFMRRLNKMAADQEGNGYGWSANDYKGDAFEALIEVMVNLMSADLRIGIAEYEPYKKADYGVDGHGWTNEITPRRVVVQAKYRSNVKGELTANKDHLSNFVAFSKTSEEYKDADMVIITTAKKLNDVISTEMYHDQVRVIKYNDLNRLLKNNVVFWNKFREEMGI